MNPRLIVVTIVSWAALSLPSRTTSAQEPAVPPPLPERDAVGQARICGGPALEEIKEYLKQAREADACPKPLDNLQRTPLGNLQRAIKATEYHCRKLHKKLEEKAKDDVIQYRSDILNYQWKQLREDYSKYIDCLPKAPAATPQEPSVPAPPPPQNVHGPPVEPLPLPNSSTMSAGITGSDVPWLLGFGLGALGIAAGAILTSRIPSVGPSQKADLTGEAFSSFYTGGLFCVAGIYALVTTRTRRTALLRPAVRVMAGPRGLAVAGSF